jgi:hypothetical protein
VVAARPGVSVVRLLAGAAVTGVVAGVVLARARQAPDPLLGAERAAEVAPPVGAAPARRATPDLMAPDPLSLRGLPPYPKASPRRLLGARPGRPLEAISWFSTSDSLDRVLGFYEQAFAAGKLNANSYRWGDRRGYVSWYEYRYPDDGGSPGFEGVLHMVSASREGGQTVVLLSATDPDRMLTQASPLPVGMRLPPGAQPQVLDLGELGQQRATVFAHYPEQTPEGLADQLAKVWRADGWVLEERLAALDGRVSLVARQGGRLQLVVVEPAPVGVRLLVNLEERGSSASQGASP